MKQISSVLTQKEEVKEASPSFTSELFGRVMDSRDVCQLSLLVLATPLEPELSVWSCSRSRMSESFSSQLSLAQISGMAYIGIFITAFGNEQQTPSSVAIAETIPACTPATCFHLWCLNR